MLSVVGRARPESVDRLCGLLFLRGGPEGGVPGAENREELRTSIIACNGVHLLEAKFTPMSGFFLFWSKAGALSRESFSNGASGLVLLAVARTHRQGGGRGKSASRRIGFWQHGQSGTREMVSAGTVGVKSSKARMRCQRRLAAGASQPKWRMR